MEENERQANDPRSRYSRLDTLDSAAMNHLVVWFRAVEMQAERVRDPERHRRDRQIDGYQFVHVLRQALRAAHMLRDQLTGKPRDLADAAVARFETAVPDAKNARDILDHFDDYSSGVGNLSHPRVNRNRRQPTEEAARQFDVFYEIGHDGAYTLHFGDLTVPIEPAQLACSTLIDELLTAVGLTAVEDELAMGDLGEPDAANPMTTATIFLSLVWSGDFPATNVQILDSVTSESFRKDWPDYAEVGRLLGGYALATRPVRPTDDIAHIKVVPDTGRTRQAQAEIVITDVWWLTLCRRPHHLRPWLIYSLGRAPGMVS